jgi:hypothetical protein
MTQFLSATVSNERTQPTKQQSCVGIYSTCIHVYHSGGGGCAIKNVRGAVLLFSSPLVRMSADQLLSSAVAAPTHGNPATNSCG